MKEDYKDGNAGSNNKYGSKKLLCFMPFDHVLFYHEGGSLLGIIVDKKRAIQHSQLYKKDIIQTIQKKYP